MAVWTNFGQLTLCSVSIFILFTAYATTKNIVAKLLRDDDLGSLGFLAMCVVYVFYTLGSFFGTAIRNYIGRTGSTMSLGAFGYTTFVACCILPALMANNIYNDPEHRIPDSGFLSKTPITICFVIAAACCGTGAGIFWTSEGSFVSRAACEENKGFYHSYSWCWLLATYLVGNPLASMILKQGGPSG